MMTERSTFSATQGVKKARKKVKKVKQDPDFYIPPVETKKFTPGFGGVDGSQIMPPRNQQIFESLNRERPPLYLPKQQSPEKKPKAVLPAKKRQPSPNPPQVPQQVEE